jgi:predicted RNA-binding Zn ribbon-like protein
MPHHRLTAVQTEFVWQWDEDATDLDRVLWPIAQSAAELLTSPELARVRECAKEHCNWLFVDRSKNRSRRWCDMQECGNVAKVRRYRSRKQAGG